MAAFIFISMLFFYSVFFHSNTKAYVGWIVLGCSTLVGILVGFLLAKFSKVGVAILAGWGGVALFLILWSSFFYFMNSQVAFWILLVAFALIFAGLSFVLYDHALIISTALVGSYAFVRGISFYAGRYPNEFTIINMIESGLITHIDPVFYGYLAGILVFCVVGIAVQYKMRSKEHDKERHPYYNLR